MIFFSCDEKEKKRKNYAGISNRLFILKVHISVTNKEEKKIGNATKRIDMCHM